jgi:pyruvate dehydrogenase E2 component (dihydrolipoamide acetyltransferase)
MSGTLMAVIADADEDITAALTDRVTAVPSTGGTKSSAASRAAVPVTPPAVAEGAPPIASPRAKALAAERGIDLSALTGSGPGGRIVEADVLNAQAPAVPALPAGTDQPLSQMRKAIARAMIRSKAPVPHFYLTNEIAMEQAEQLRDRLKHSRQPHPSITDLLIKAAALALNRHPEINVSYTGEGIRRYTSIDVGIAVGMEDGLITPVIRNCGAKTLDDISTETRVLIERAKQKRLQPHEYTGATFSISNLGMFEVENFIAVLMPPQAASMAVGAIRDVPVVIKGSVGIGRRMKVTLSCDHRALDGLMGAEFLKEFKRILEHPQELTTPVVAT